MNWLVHVWKRYDLKSKSDSGLKIKPLTKSGHLNAVPIFLALLVISVLGFWFNIYHTLEPRYRGFKGISIFCPILGRPILLFIYLLYKEKLFQKLAKHQIIVIYYKTLWIKMKRLICEEVYPSVVQLFHNTLWKIRFYFKKDWMSNIVSAWKSPRLQIIFGKDFLKELAQAHR